MVLAVKQISREVEERGYENATAVNIDISVEYGTTTAVVCGPKATGSFKFSKVPSKADALAALKDFIRLYPELTEIDWTDMVNENTVARVMTE